MPALSQAAAMLDALAAPARLALLSAVVARTEAGQDCSLAALAASLDRPLAALVKDVTRLDTCGLVAVRGRTVVPTLAALRETAGDLVAQLPVSALLAGRPDLERYFTHGRLDDLTVDHDVKLRLAPMLAGLLPDDREMTEAEVNAVLAQVHDDHAYLRRMLVDFGQLTRDGSAGYRRAG
ncbi:DUF2087 domain-containing protein [Mangrovihabitans endophyticus]|uniref:DUF2087 domain-containing protein n=1 Tax=Mangrovihabitans endophyticus TaxID=1751298 RepID=A0A8J3C8A4_9ACTN|nr:DUF2087 domain-containing protein [Mangrovihabitans endophyticus]GGL19333.1 hypothetical protein GCM10012284_62320 [Mangrovihabitans endophyticus]